MRIVLKVKTRLYRLSGNKYAIYIPQALLSDSQFPFKDKKAPLEIVIMPSKIEGVGKLLVKPAEQEEKCGKPSD